MTTTDVRSQRIEDAALPLLASVAPILPEYRYEQEELIGALERLWSDQHYNSGRLRRLHEAVQVGSRNLALPLEKYFELENFGDRNDAFIEVATELGGRAIRQALDEAGYTPQDVDAIFFTTVTGISTPTIDARLVNQIGLRRDVKRTPLFGLGCVAGAAGTARMTDYLRAYPDQVAVLLSVELCSLTIQPEDLSVANLIATGLFGDGAAAVVGVGSRRAATDGIRGPRVEDTRSTFHRNTEGIMGWTIDGSGFGIVLSADLPSLVREAVRDDVESFLEANGLTLEDVDRWVAHPGGPAVLDAMEDALSLDRSDLQVTRDSLEQIGNLSSASVLFVLADTMRTTAPEDDIGLLMAMGPGFCSESVLLRW